MVTAQPVFERCMCVYIYVCVCVSEPHQSVMKEFLKIKRKFHAGPSSLRGRTRSQAPFNLL